MSKVIRLKYPDPEASGATFIQPLENFTANGFNWRKSLKFKRESFAWKERGKTYLLVMWGEPKIVRERGDFIRLDWGKVCRCAKCIKGRRKVRAGWTPWGRK